MEILDQYLPRVIATERDRFTWSIHRPHTVIGMAVGNAMNLGTTLAVYASICKENGPVFQFPGSEAQWKGLSDVNDARMLAKQLVWAADTDAARNEAFNIVNDDVFFAGAGCEEGWQPGSVYKRLVLAAARRRSKPRWQTIMHCGARLRSAMCWSSQI